MHLRNCVLVPVLGQITILIPDEIESRLRVRVAERFGGKKGALGEAIAEGIELWLKQSDGAKEKVESTQFYASPE